jgi:PilZ domain
MERCYEGRAASAAALKSRENRRGLRHAVLSHAQIIFGGIVANCIVRDLSEAGARLGISQRIKLPLQFDLRFARHGLELKARVRWRRGDFVGVSFCFEEQVAKLVRKNRQKRLILKA